MGLCLLLGAGQTITRMMSQWKQKGGAGHGFIETVYTTTWHYIPTAVMQMQNVYTSNQGHSVHFTWTDPCQKPSNLLL